MYTPYKLTIQSADGDLRVLHYATREAAVADYSATVDTSEKREYERGLGSEAWRVILTQDGTRLYEHTPDGFLDAFLREENPDAEQATTMLLNEILEQSPDNPAIPDTIKALAMYIERITDGVRSDAK
jgi:hypothetical protein